MRDKRFILAISFLLCMLTIAILLHFRNEGKMHTQDLPSISPDDYIVQLKKQLRDTEPGSTEARRLSRLIDEVRRKSVQAGG